MEHDKAEHSCRHKASFFEINEFVVQNGLTVASRDVNAVWSLRARKGSWWCRPRCQKQGAEIVNVFLCVSMNSKDNTMRSAHVPGTDFEKMAVGERIVRLILETSPTGRASASMRERERGS